MSDKLEKNIQELLKNSEKSNKPISIPKAPDDAGAKALSEALDSGFKIVKLLIVCLVLAFIYSLTFSVQPDEIAIKLRFGKPVGVGESQILRPGLHWAFPYPIDEIVYISVGQSRTLVSTAGWFATTPELEAMNELPPPNEYLRPGIDGYVLTSDGNVVHARATLKYRLNPAKALNYEFNFVDSTNLLKDILDNSIFYAASHFTAEDAIYRDKIGFTEAVRQRVTQIVDKYNIGINIETVEVDTKPPLAVLNSFDLVLGAQQEARTEVNKAKAYARSTINSAQGQASTILADGITRSNQIVRTIASEAKSFSEQLPYFEKNPSLFKERLLTESMQQILTNADDIFFMPEPKEGTDRELRLQLNREQQKSQREKAKEAK